MAIFVQTEDPDGLLSAVKKAIDDDRVRTWSYDSDGDFTHTAEQWKNSAWLRPRKEDGRLIFNIVPPQGKTITKTLFGIYHGRFIEMLLTHFDRKFTRASISALASTNDRVKG
jgi:hypothetical protein